MIRRSWPEVTLQAQDRAPDVLARGEVDAHRTPARAREVEHHLTRVEIRLDACVSHFEADIELRSRVPDRPDADRPDIPVWVAACHNRRTRERGVRSGEAANGAL